MILLYASFAPKPDQNVYDANMNVESLRQQTQFVYYFSHIFKYFWCLNQEQVGRAMVSKRNDESKKKTK